MTSEGLATALDGALVDRAVARADGWVGRRAATTGKDGGASGPLAALMHDPGGATSRCASSTGSTGSTGPTDDRVAACARVPVSTMRTPPLAGERIGLLGTPPPGLPEHATSVGATLINSPVVRDGRREMLTVLRE